ncbi:substrate-binding domain-containing protein [Caulobacter soli]|uniref:substrate-binding domain-containing protein n=1 Tax=Caulobacter soli TaxID=2708539 RepID=UPI0013EDE610|nr:phosphate ABC transporter substrate-binding/OmpA family protein [Caulobacter soli]
MPLQAMRQADKAGGLKVGAWARPAAIIGGAVLALVLAGWLLSLVVKPTTGQVDLVLSGSNSIGGKLGPALAKAWLESEGGQKVRVEETGEEEARVSGRVNGEAVTIVVKAHDTGSGFKDAAAGRADIVMASRSMKGKEGDALGPAWTNPTAEHVIAYDGIAVIVSPHNTVETLSIRQLHDIYTGQITDWGQVGGLSGRRIRVFAREQGSGTRDGFTAKALQGDDIVGATEIKDSAKLESMVAEDRDAIGFVAMPYVKTAVALSISAGQVDAFAPTMFTVRSERYPLFRRLYLYTTGDNPRADPFLAFVRSDAGQKVVKETGFVDLRVQTDFTRAERVSEHEIGRCGLSSRWDGDPNEYCSLIKTANLQPAVIKFRSGSDELDSLARDDVQRFLRAAQANPNRTLILAGHADSLGRYKTNCRLSLFRAEAVRKVLAQNGVTNTSIRGFCDEIPRGDNETPDGRDANRRVELLVK